jgi:hypothetical protein
VGLFRHFAKNRCRRRTSTWQTFLLLDRASRWLCSAKLRLALTASNSGSGSDAQRAVHYIGLFLYVKDQLKGRKVDGFDRVVCPRRKILAVIRGQADARQTPLMRRCGREGDVRSLDIRLCNAARIHCAKLTSLGVSQRKHTRCNGTEQRGPAWRRAATHQRRRIAVVSQAQCKTEQVRDDVARERTFAWRSVWGDRDRHLARLLHRMASCCETVCHRSSFSRRSWLRERM